jgi:aryl-alcohol dehydrogenase-like predicted oxidoreductase
MVRPHPGATIAGMNHRPLGSSGLVVSVVGLGCNAFGRRIDADASTAVIHAALDEGITLFDTADSYGFGASETILGRALGSRRAEAVVATKFGSDMQGRNGPDWGARASRRYIRTAVTASLRRLGTDWIDLYQLHEPDGMTPFEETLVVLDEIVAEGKVRYVGSSNLAAWQVVEADWVARTGGYERFVSAQNKYSIYDRAAEAELVPACERVGVGILPYFPLEYGLLTGKYRRDEPAPEGSRLAVEKERFKAADFDRIEALEHFATQHDIGLLDVAIGGLAAQPAVASVIAGATRPEQVRANVAASRWQPTAGDLVALDEVSPSKRGRSGS